MAAPLNILQQVQLYLPASLGRLVNQNCFFNTANFKFQNFDKNSYSLGSTVNFVRPPRVTDTSSLVATFQGAAQLLQPLTVDLAFNVALSYTAQERIFNVDKDVYNFMKDIGESAVVRLGSRFETILAKNANSSVPIGDVDGNPTGAFRTESGPYRFFGDGRTPISSYTQLAQAVTNFKNFGAVQHGMKFYLPDVAIPSIVGSGLNQFSPKRNDEIAMSWEIGEFGTPPVQYYSSNLLPIQNAGTVGNANRTLTVVSTNDPTGQNITQITFSDTTATDSNSIKAGDLIQFQDNVGSLPNLRFATYQGTSTSAQPVQIRAIADAATSTSTVVVNFYPPLTADPANINSGNIAISSNIIAGMQVKALPSHRCGLIVGGDALYAAMPKLPNEDPYATASEYDDETGVSLRMYYGSQFGRNQRGMIWDGIIGTTAVPDYCMRVAFPL